MLARADDALYGAKRVGRDRVAVVEECEPTPWPAGGPHLRSLRLKLYSQTEAPRIVIKAPLVEVNVRL